jgi:GNAT superfamily N-acetyltransferase
LEAFDSGVPQLDDWLRRRARRNDNESTSRGFVLCAGRRVVGYHSLAAESVLTELATGTVRRNMPVPVVLLGRLAVDRGWQGRGLGADPLRDALLRALAAGRSIGVRAILVHAISDQARGFYERHGFRVSRGAPLTLMVTVREAARALGGE